MSRIPSTARLTVSHTLRALFFVALGSTLTVRAAPRSSKDVAPTIRMAELIQSPAPKYPEKADEKHWTGTGTYLLTFEPTGKVSDAVVVQSTGHELLDDEAIHALRHWRCKPGVYSQATVPITFTAPSLPRSAEFVTTDPETERKKGNLLSAPVPKYPYEAQRYRLTGKGVFEVNFQPDGRVDTVVVARSTGQRVLDFEARRVLRTWRAKPGAFARIFVPVTFGWH